MSQLSYIAQEPLFAEGQPVQGIPWFETAQRSIWQPILLIFPLLFAAAGYIMQAAALVDLAFIAVTILCAIFLIAELLRFSERFGIAGLILYGGVLLWFSYDYLSHWFMAWYPHWTKSIPQSAVAKSATCHMLYILCLSVGIRFRWGRWLPRLITNLPEPREPTDYFWVVIIAQIIGLSPFFIFTSEPFYMAIYHQITAGRGGIGTAWTVGRTGNVNYSWGAYVAQLLQIGSGSAILASFCLVFIRQNWFRTSICAFLWLLWMLMGFGTGTRGEVVYLFVPLLCFLFIRYHVRAQELLHSFSFRGYIVAAVIIVLAVALVQTQIRFRNTGFSDVNFSDVTLTTLEGNTMFSEGLRGFELIPERHDFFYDQFPGETIVWPVPNLLMWMVIAPMPRALWTSKPIDPSWEWYNSVFSGESARTKGTTVGTTIAQGVVGYWYFRFGIPGVIEGGLFMGWLLECFESALYNNRGRCIAVLAALGLSTWFFRAFRDIGLADLTECLVGLAGLILCTLIIRPFTVRQSPAPADFSHQQ